MQIIITSREAVTEGGGGRVGQLYDFNVSTDCSDFFAQVVRKAADECIRILKENADGGAV